jgi:hypothetical protein
MNRFYLVFALLGLLPEVSKSQEITNVRAVATGSLVHIYYDLQEAMEGQLFEVSIYASHNSLAEPLTYVRGDIGSDIRAGKDKRIEWGAKKELGTYAGELVFEIRARLTFSPLSFQQPLANAVYRRGKVYTLEWQGGVEGEALQLELWQDGVKSMDIGQFSNRKRYEWAIPLALKPGKNFTVKVSSPENPANYSISDSFVIRRKIPLAVKILPLGIASGVAAVLLTRTTEPVPVVRTRLPAPPDPE